MESLVNGLEIFFEETLKKNKEKFAGKEKVPNFAPPIKMGFEN
jgi:hypothetical protein